MQTELKEKINFLIDSSKIGVSKDFTAEEKKLVFDHFESFQLTAPTCRNRFFRDGWHQWEIIGVIGCMLEYSNDHPEVHGLAEEARKLTLQTDVDEIQELVSAYYESLEVKKSFVDYMESLGLSHSSCVSHFRNPQSFLPWELFGIRRIFDAF